MILENNSLIAEQLGIIFYEIIFLEIQLMNKVEFQTDCLIYEKFTCMEYRFKTQRWKSVVFLYEQCLRVMFIIKSMEIKLRAHFERPQLVGNKALLISIS